MSQSTFCESFRVQSDNVQYSEDYITTSYKYATTELRQGSDGVVTVVPREDDYVFRVERKVPKLGLMLVGWGGNNGSTVTAGVLANKHDISWETKDGVKKPNYYGSVTQSATVRLGNLNGCEAYAPFSALVPMVNPNDIVLGGWDISRMNLADAMRRAKVVDIDLQRKLYPLMEDMWPLPGIFDGSFIAPNQGDRADNVLYGSKQHQLDQIRRDISNFKDSKGVDKVIVLWTANTERYSEVREGLNMTEGELMASIARDDPEVSPSTLYAVAALLEGVPFINGSPQNTSVPGLVELAERVNVLIGGDDFKSGQTKIKSLLVEFLVGAGIKPTAIASYNHLGNNDGKNLTFEECFKSKEISKSDIVKEIIDSNPILFKPGASSPPDHCVVIKYIPEVGDSKRALDEYTSDIFMGGKNVMVIHNTCEDSLLASPIILDLVILSEIITRVEISAGGSPLRGIHPVASLLSYLTKAPLVPRGTPLVNSLGRQRAMLENFFRACAGLAPENNMLLEFKLRQGGVAHV